MFWVAPARPSACAAWRCVPFRRARPDLPEWPRASRKGTFLMLMTKRLNGLSRFGKLSGIRDIPYPGRAASVRRGAGSGDGIRHLRHTAIPWRAGRESPEHLRATGLQTAPAWHRINARAGHPVTGRAWPCHACASRRILPRGLPGPARQRAPAAFPARQQRPVVDDRRDFLQEESPARAAAILPIGSSMFWSKYRWIDATAVSRSSRSSSIGILPASVCIHEGYETRTKRAAGQRKPGRATLSRRAHGRLVPGFKPPAIDVARERPPRVQGIQAPTLHNLER